ncbi:MAG: GNAT family N-acetyltransferase [Chloroflexota bacterium]
MFFKPRAYAGVDDLRKIQAATASWIASVGFMSYLHVEDIALRLFNGMRRYKPTEIVRLWEDSDSSLLGWAMLYPRWNSYEALLNPAFRGSELESQLLDWCEAETAVWIEREGCAVEGISVEVFAEDSPRIALLEKRGYARGEQHHVIGARYLDDPIPDVPLPDGFSIRPMAGLQETEKLIAVQNATFGWSWTPETYRPVLESPAFQAEQQLVVVAPDGQFGAFCYLMLDTHNKIGMFEDVGTHPDFQRRGLGRALLLDGFRHMAARGMQTAFVPYVLRADAAVALYASAGFQVRYRHYLYRKKSPTKT